MPPERRPRTDAPNPGTRTTTITRSTTATTTRTLRGGQPAKTPNPRHASEPRSGTAGSRRGRGQVRLFGAVGDVDAVLARTEGAEDDGGDVLGVWATMPGRGVPRT